MTDGGNPPALPEGYGRLNSYSRIIVDEALRRGIEVEVLDAEAGELVLSQDGRRMTTVQSLSELTSAVAFRRCDDKLRTRRVLEQAGLRVPAGRAATFDEEDAAFLERWKEIVVKPARGEGGAGVTVGVVDPDALTAAVDRARTVCPRVLLEQRCHGEDLRVVVIGDEVVAASVRRPPAVTGNGRDTVRALVEGLSTARADATAGASRIPLDEATVHDVTERLHPELGAVALRAADAIGIPVVGIDLVVPAVDGPEYVVIEANEQPGLANHEPQPTAERFLDLLFPG
jgi:D-alanine-D-alanine ligase-like ATP-grasp enzyme